MKVNSFGRPLFRKNDSESALNAGKSTVLSISRADLEQFAPFCYLHLENWSGEKLRITLDGAVYGDDSVQEGKYTYNLSPLTAIDLTPFDNGRPDVVFQQVLLSNLDAAANIAADEIKWTVRNF